MIAPKITLKSLFTQKDNVARGSAVCTRGKTAYRVYRVEGAPQPTDVNLAL